MDGAGDARVGEEKIKRGTTAKLLETLIMGYLKNPTKWKEGLKGKPWQKEFLSLVKLLYPTILTTDPVLKEVVEWVKSERRGDR